MNRTQTACFALLASAFVLSAILIVRIDQKAQPNAAQADMVITQPAFTMMTARTRGDVDSGEESLFILDNTGGALIVYTPQLAKDQLEPIVAIKVSKLFGGRN